MDGQPEPQTAVSPEFARYLETRDLVTEAKKLFDKAVEADRENRNRAREDLDFIAGNQWDARDVKQRQVDRRPTLTINRMPQFLKQVANEVRRNRPAITCTPADGLADPRVAQVFEGMIRAIERISGANRVYSRAVEQSAGCGMGHFRLSLEYEDEESFDMGLRIRSIRNPFSVVWDPGAANDDKSDAKYAFVYQDLTEEEFKASYPDAAKSPWNAANPLSTAGGAWGSGARKITVCEYWQVKDEPIRLVKVRHDRAWFDPELGHQTPTNQETILEDPDDVLLTEVAQQGFSVVAARQATRKRVCMYLLGGNEVLEGPIETPFTRIPIFSVVGDETELGDQTVRSSLIRHAKDPQRLLNYYASADVEMHALAPKVPFILSARQVAGLENLWATANQGTRAFLPYNDVDETGEIKAPKPSREQGIGTNPGLMAGAQAASQYMKDTTGIYDASLGQKSNETSGVAINARDAQADTGAFNYVDNLAHAIEAMGREMIAVIPKVYAPDRQIRILGQDDAPTIIDMAREGIRLDRGKYDIAVKVGPAFETQREEMRSALIDLAKAAGPLGPIYHIEIARLYDHAGADQLADRLEAAAGAMGLIPPPPGAAPPGMQGPPPGMPLPAPPGGAPPELANILPPSGAFPAPGPRVAPRPMPQGARGI